jgi:hypothetical protein
MPPWPCGKVFLEIRSLEGMRYLEEWNAVLGKTGYHSSVDLEKNLVIPIDEKR